MRCNILLRLAGRYGEHPRMSIPFLPPLFYQHTFYQPQRSCLYLLILRPEIRRQRRLFRDFVDRRRIFSRCRIIRRTWIFLGSPDRDQHILIKDIDKLSVDSLVLPDALHKFESKLPEHFTGIIYLRNAIFT